MKCFLYIFVIISLLLMPNCSRYVKLFKCTFYGGDDVCSDLRAACPYMCSLAIYDQFQTIGLFDVMWLSEPVRRLYVTLLSRRLCLTSQEVEAVLKKELTELKDSLAFYVLMPRMCYDTLTVACNYQPPWAVCLKVNGICYQPCNTIQLFELSPEYCYILGERFNRYRQPYHVIFSAYDMCGEPLITECTNCIELIISSVRYSTSCTWRRTPTGWCASCAG